MKNITINLGNNERPLELDIEYTNEIESPIKEIKTMKGGNINIENLKEENQDRIIEIFEQTIEEVF
jgi:hypothetical protein